MGDDFWLDIARNEGVESPGFRASSGDILFSFRDAPGDLATSVSLAPEEEAEEAAAAALDRRPSLGDRSIRL